MRNTRRVVYSVLAIPFLVLACFLASMDSVGRSSFVGEFRRNTQRMLAGDWDFSEFKSRRSFDQFQRRGYREFNPVSVFDRLDRNDDGGLTSDEVGRRLRGALLAHDANHDQVVSEREFHSAWYLRSVPIESPVGSSKASVADESQEDAPSSLTVEQLLDPTHVVEVDIQIKPEDWQSLCSQSRNWQSAVEDPLDKPYTYFPARITIDGVTIDNVGLRKKGFIGSQDVVRPSMKVKFDKYADQQPIPGMSKMTLNNNKQDRALVSQSLTYWLFRKAGIAAPRTTFASVTVNGRYLGVYTHVESVGTELLARAFGDGSGKLYEGTLTDFYPKSMEWLEPKNDVAEQDRTEVVDLAKELFAEEGDFTNRVAQHVDLDHFLKYWAIETLIRFWDGYTQNQNNYFVYHHPQNGLLYFLPWGADSCFGGGHRGRGNGPPYAVRASSILANKLYHQRDIPERYRNVMRDVLSQVWDEKEILAEIQRLETLLFDHVDFTQLSALAELEGVRSFVRTRRAFIQEELDQRWPVRIGGFNRPMYFEPIGLAEGSFTWQPGGALDDLETAGIQITMHGEQFDLQSPAVHCYRDRMLRSREATDANGPADSAPRPTHFEFTGLDDIQSYMFDLRDKKPDGTSPTIDVRGNLLGLASHYPVRGQLHFADPDARGSVLVTFELTVFRRHEKNR